MVVVVVCFARVELSHESQRQPLILMIFDGGRILPRFFGRIRQCGIVAQGWNTNLDFDDFLLWPTILWKNLVVWNCHTGVAGRP